MVCIDCGTLIRDKDVFKSDPMQKFTTNDHHLLFDLNLSSGIRNYLPSNRITTAKKMGRRTVETLAANLSLTSEMKEDALMRWHETCFHKNFFNSSKHTKTILAATCVYISMKKFRNPIAFSQICNAIGCETSEFARVYNQVIRFYPEYKPPETQIQDLVPVVLSEAKLEDEERKKLEEKVVKIINLEKELWLVDGRSPIHIIFAAAFLAWKSLDPYKRKKIKLTNFCELLSIEFKHTTSERVTELVKVLTDLVKRIPGKSNLKITKQNVALYIDDILNYQNLILYDLNCQMKNVESESQDNNWNTFKRPINQDKKRKRHSEETNVQSNDLSNEEIDAEVSAYIRSDKEVKFIKKLKKLAGEQA